MDSELALLTLYVCSLVCIVSTYYCNIMSLNWQTDLHPIKEATSGIDGLYWCVDYPWPMSDRDVSYHNNDPWFTYTCTCTVDPLLTDTPQQPTPMIF